MNQKLEKEKRLTDHKLKEGLLQSKVQEQTAAKKELVELQAKLLETQEKIAQGTQEVKAEVKEFAVETKELIKDQVYCTLLAVEALMALQVINETTADHSPLAAAVNTAVEEAGGDTEKGINRLATLVKQSNGVSKPSTLNETLREMQGRITTVISVPMSSSKKASKGSNQTEAEADVSPGAKLIDADHNEYVLVKSGATSAAISTDRTLMKDLVPPTFLIG